MRQPHIFQIGSTNYTTREYCQSKGITDDYAIKKIQWRINTYVRNHPVRETTEELIRLVSLSNVTSNTAKEVEHEDQVYVLTPSGRRYHRKCSQYHEPSVTCQNARKDPLSDWRDWRHSPLTPIQDLTARLDRQEENSETPTKTPDGIRPWQGTKKEREIAQNILQQSKWMEHNEKWLNEAGILPNAEDIIKANKPTYDPLQADLDLQHAVKEYALAIQRVDALNLEMKEAQKELHEWHTKTINIINTQNYELQKWIGSA